MQIFRVGITGDFLNTARASAYGDVGLSLLDATPFIRYHFTEEHIPSLSDPTYYDRLYSLQVTANHIADIDGLVLLRPWVKAETFSRGADNLVVIGRSGAGYDKIDVAACTANDVAVFNAPTALTHATASSALMFMLALAKRLPAQERITRQGRWDLQPDVVGSELQGRTLGIVGLGASGRELARLVAPFGLRIIAYSPKADPAQAAALGVTLTSLDDLCREADYISLHASLTPERHKMIGARHFALMKPSAYFINVARGALVDQAALARALQERRIAGAGLDVFAHEPLATSDPLTSLDNVILTPHWLPTTHRAVRLVSVAMSEGILRAARGLVPENVVNPEVLERDGFKAKLASFAVNG